MPTLTTPAPPPVLASSLSAEELSAVTTLYQAFDDKNPDLLDGVLTPDWQDAPLVPGQVDGPQGLKDQFPVFFQAFPDLKIVIHEIIGGAGRVGVRASITGTHQGEVMGFAPTGKSVDMAIYEFHYIRDGRITHTWHLEDWFGMFNQIGVWPLAADARSKTDAE